MNNIKRKLLNIILSSRFKGGIVATIGYILSPLSWWNDVFVNIPISYAVACIVAYFNRDLFIPSFITAYLITNVVGLIMMHLGVEEAVRGKAKLTKGKVLKYIIVSLAYTLLVSYLALIGFIKPIT